MTVSVNDLLHGKRIEYWDILELLAAEEQIKEAAQTFGSVPRAATQFGGEEVIPIFLQARGQPSGSHRGGPVAVPGIGTIAFNLDATR